jgi:predicted DNA-binding transcriptional regulator AlpA
MLTRREKIMPKTKDDYPIVLTVNEVMEILRIGKRVAYMLMNRTDFPTKKMGI